MRFWRSNLIAALVSVLIASTPVLASPASQPVKMPKGKIINNLKSYTLEEMKVILSINADYKSWFFQIPLKDQQIKGLTAISKNLSEQMKTTQADVKILREDRDRLYKKWVDENKKRHLAENRPQIGSWIAWTAAVVATVAAAVLSVILVTKD
jgi:hypothetical protein